MIGFIGTSLQLQTSITAHNQWLLKTRTIPYWTTSVFPSTVTDLVVIYYSATYESLRMNDEWRITFEWTLSSLVNESEWIHEWTLFHKSERTEEKPRPPRTLRLLLCVFHPLLWNVPGDLLPSNGGPYTVICLTSRICSPNRCLAMVIFVAIYFCY
jgi:hypothetical protein